MSIYPLRGAFVLSAELQREPDAFHQFVVIARNALGMLTPSLTVPILEHTRCSHRLIDAPPHYRDRGYGRFGVLQVRQQKPA